MDRVFPAHIRMKGHRQTVQTVRAHNEAVARYAGERLLPLGLQKTGELAGLLHDMGKAKQEFADYLYAAVQNPDCVKRGSVNHTFAAVRFLLERHHPAGPIDAACVTAELLAYADGAHHGLFDCIDEQHKSGFDYRKSKEDIGYEETLENYLSQCADTERLDELFDGATAEITPLLEKLGALPDAALPPEKANAEIQFYYGLLARMVLSAVMDGDRQDTAEFMEDTPYPVQRTGEERREMWQKCLAFLEEKLERFPQDTPIQKARRAISDRCADCAKSPGGVLRLNVPTGGGKTLSALRYALAHAAKWNKSRIILTSSLLSILDQNAAVIRGALPDQSLILEHHSDVVRTKELERQPEWEMLCEQWSAPIVVTTLVQLLNTLFSGKTACIRRFQALADSIIVIDEVQTVPAHLLTLFNLAVNFLSAVCHATVVLCSATQPELERADHPICCAPAEMVPHDAGLWKPFDRTEIRYAGAVLLDNIPGFAMQKLEETDSLLIICNTKAEAQHLYAALEAAGVRACHLSAGMCMQHRRDTLKSIQDALAAGEKTVCISTQVIEAGVDISFGCVIRLAAGMDSVVQAAGRCNRNGESGSPSPVYLINCADERLRGLADIADGKTAAIALLNAYEKDPGRFGGSLSSPEAIRFYYSSLYAAMKSGYQDGYLPEHGTSLYHLLADNSGYLQGAAGAGTYLLNQAFKTAGNAFSVFREDTVEVLVPYRQGRELRTALLQADRGGHPDYTLLNQLLQEAKGYTVSLYPHQIKALTDCGGVEALFDGRVNVLLDGFYHEKTGFSLKQNDQLWEV